MPEAAVCPILCTPSAIATAIALRLTLRPISFCQFGIQCLQNERALRRGAGTNWLQVDLDKALQSAHGMPMEQYQAFGYFDVIGSDTHRRYRIFKGRFGNVKELSENDRPDIGGCFFPEGGLVADDCMLAGLFFSLASSPTEHGFQLTRSGSVHRLTFI